MGELTMALNISTVLVIELIAYLVNRRFKSGPGHVV